MEEKNLQEVAANAAVVDNAANAVVENPAAEAVDLYSLATTKGEHQRTKQREAFGTHFGGTTDREKILKRIETTLELLPKWEQNLNSLKQEFSARAKSETLTGLLDGVEQTDEIKAALATLQAAMGMKA